MTPVVVALEVAIRPEEVLRLLGYPPGRTAPERITRRLDLALVEARQQVRPRGAWLRFDPDEAGAVGVPPIDRPAARETSGFVLALVTIGGTLEAAATAAARADRVTHALLLDAAGSAAVEEAADRLSLLVDPRGEPTARDALVPCRFSPGYGDWPLEAQREVLARLPHREIGVELLPSCLMAPRKSVSFALWLDPAGHPLSGPAGCARCPLATCPYRRGEN